MPISGLHEGYTKIQSKTSHKLPCEVSAMLFVALCQGIDQYRDQTWRFDYKPRKVAIKSGGGYDVEVLDIGD